MRKNRVLRKGATYHVSAKINRSEMIFESNEFKNLFLHTVKRAKEDHEFLIRNFTIMDNHIHFLIQPLGNSSLSKIMQWILSVFAINYNLINKIHGHVWQGRFFSRTIDDIRQYFDTFNYISDNPVKAGLVNNAKDYKYGALYFIFNEIFDIVERNTAEILLR